MEMESSSSEFKITSDRLLNAMNQSRQKHKNFIKYIVYSCIRIIIVIPLTITTIIMGSIRPEDCHHPLDDITVTIFLLMLGISEIIWNCWSLLIDFLLIDANKFKILRFINTVIKYTRMLYMALTLLIGGYLLFQANLDCIKNSSATIVYALIIWCIYSIYLIISVCACVFETDRQ